ncbi:MAG: stalk domain-containing protein [Tumebacillaceae bacterium]
MKKHWRFTAAAAALLLVGLFGQATPSHAASGQGEVHVQVNDKLIQFPDAVPFADDNNRTQVPIRFVSESLGYKVDWSFVQGDVRVTLASDTKQIVMTTGQNDVNINGEEFAIDTEPVLLQGRTYVPVRHIAEALGAKVEWDDATNTAIISTDGVHHASVAPKPQPIVKSTSVGASIVNNAKAYLGVPYAWGGTTPNGFDCSGLIYYVYQKNGVTLPVRTSTTMSKLGQAVDRQNLQAGDLVFFSTSGGSINHVGIALDNNRFISATSSKGVKIDSLDSSYWGPRYKGAKRVL